MSQGVSVTSGYGWVIVTDDGEYAVELEEHLSDDQRKDLSEAINRVVSKDGIAVVYESFGYDFEQAALLASDSVHESYDYVHEAAQHAPNVVAEAQYRRELLQALDALEWDEAGLGEPKWLILITYG
jgi:hypothetical protein